MLRYVNTVCLLLSFEPIQVEITLGLKSGFVSALEGGNISGYSTTFGTSSILPS